MRTLRVLVATALAAGALAVLAPEAHGSVPAVSTKVKKFCKAADKISVDDTSNSSASDDAEELASDIKKAAKLAPTKRLKNALGDMEDYFNAVADADSPGDLADLGDVTVKYGKAAAVFTGYLISNCSFS
jgi:hypothetical protein